MNMGLRYQITSFPTRIRLALHVLTRRKYVPWGMNAWIDVRALLKSRGNPVDSRCVVFDVGANRGQTVSDIRRWLPAVVIHCFEPMPETFGRLRSNVREASLHPYGLGGRVGTYRMDPSENDLTARVLEESGTDGGAGEFVDVELSTIDAEMEKHDLDRIHVLKIDVEGNEMSVLEGADRALNEGRIDLILVEVRFGTSGESWHTPFEDLLAHLEPRGFRMVASYTNAIWPDTGINDADVLFVRVQGQPHDFLRTPMSAAR